VRQIETILTKSNYLKISIKRNRIFWCKSSLFIWATKTKW